MTLGLDKARVGSIVHRALDLGVTFFDTADLYDHGVNEELVGAALRGVRRDVVIATKVGNRWRADGSGWDWDPSARHVLQSVHDSLRRLGTDFIDLYQHHGGTIDDPFDETVDAFERLVREGLIRAWGISSIRPNVVRRYAARVAEGGAPHLTSEMVQYSLLDRRPEEEILGKAHQAGLGVLVRGAVAGGLLAGKAAVGYLGLTEAEVRGAAGALPTASAAIRFVLGHPAVTTVVAGASTVEQVETNAAAADLPPLSEAELGALRASVRVLQYTSHR